MRVKPLLVVLAVILLAVDAGLIYQRYNRGDVDVTHLYFTAAPEGGQVRLGIEIYLQNSGAADSRRLRIEVFALSYNRSQANQFVERTGMGWLTIHKDKTATTALDMLLPPAKYEIKVNLFEGDLFSESDRQVVTLTWGDAVPEGPLTRAEVPEFSSELVMVGAVVAAFALVRKRREK